jgi:PAS domain S-box-containing protein
MVDMSGFFTSFYKNAKQNSIILMNREGIIIQVNAAFTAAFGYKSGEVKGKNFRMLFTEQDKQIDKPEREISTTLSEGAMSDNNYIVHKDGAPVWVNGESVLISNDSNEKYIVKIIHNIHAQKQLERFLFESNEFIDNVFESIRDVSLMILDSSMKILKVNKSFMKMFSIKKAIEPGSKLSSLDKEFWNRKEIKSAISNTMITQEGIKNKEYSFESESGKKTIDVSTKLMDGDVNGKRILIVIKDISGKIKL